MRMHMSDARETSGIGEKRGKGKRSTKRGKSRRGLAPLSDFGELSRAAAVPAPLFPRTGTGAKKKGASPLRGKIKITTRVTIQAED